MTNYLLACLVALVSFARLHAQPLVDVVDLARNHDFAALEQHFNALELKFENNKATEYDLLDAYRPFYMREDVLANELSAWTKAYPKSYPAHLARGTYYRKLGELNRGTAPASEVSAQKFSYMDQVFAIAKPELESALRLTPKPYLAALNLLNIARYTSSTEDSDRYVALSNKLLPGNMLARGRYIDHLKPRWGGSYEKMEAFVKRSRKEGVSEANLGLLRAMIDDDRGMSAQLAGNYDEARSQYSLAMTKAKNASPRLQQDYLDSSLSACSQGLLTGPVCP
ncbi:MAG: DUF4034 domain-containing protein [Dokdonella sp.]